MNRDPERKNNISSLLGPCSKGEVGLSEGGGGGRVIVKEEKEGRERGGGR